MKSGVRKHISFFGKSMLWSLMLYVIMMLALNWDEVGMAIHGSRYMSVADSVITGVPATTVVIPSIPDTNISSGISFGGSVLKVIRILSGIAAHSY